MEQMKLTVLGCGSALPLTGFGHSSQVLEFRNKQFMIDCGEGTQARAVRYHLKTARLNHIFISHLHGDHCFGLVGLVSTLGMLGRTADIEVHAHPDLERLYAPLIGHFCSDFPFAVRFHPFSPHRSEVIYEDRSVRVTTIPLKHRVPSMTDAYSVPVSFMKDLKAGADFVTEDGEVVPNARLTLPPTPPKRYAYCSDTAYNEKIIPLIEGVDCLYHEATFLTGDKARMAATLHSSAAQAATIAAKAAVKRLIIGHYSARHNGDIAPFLEEAQSVFANTCAAKDGDVFFF